MISPKKSSTYLDNANKFKPLADVTLKKLHNDLQPYLKDKNLISLKSLIIKYESYSLDEIEHILFTDMKPFKAITHHKIREFVNRRVKLERKNNHSDMNTIYQSDDSNLVSPYSRDSFSSRSDMNLSPNMLCTMKADILNLWRYPMFQKEICQMLWNNGDCDISDSGTVTIEFGKLKPISLLALQEFINSKNKQLEAYLSNKNIKILHDLLMERSMSDEKIVATYKVLRRRGEKFEINENGKFSFDPTSLKPETVSDLIRAFRSTQPAADSDAPKPALKRGPSSSQPAPHNARSQPGSSVATAINQMRPGPAKAPHEVQSGFDNEKLRYLSRKLKECTNSERINDIIRIVKENETVDQQSGAINLNVKKMKNITIEKLFMFINSNPA